MVCIPELEATLSLPGQREGMPIQSRNILASSQSNRQHHKASTRFAGRDVWTVTGRALIVEPACFRLTCRRSMDGLLHR